MAIADMAAVDRLANASALGRGLLLALGNPLVDKKDPLENNWFYG